MIVVYLLIGSIVAVLIVQSIMACISMKMNKVHN